MERKITASAAIIRRGSPRPLNYPQTTLKLLSNYPQTTLAPREPQKAGADPNGQPHIYDASPSESLLYACATKNIFARGGCGR